MLSVSFANFQFFKGNKMNEVLVQKPHHEIVIENVNSFDDALNQFLNNLGLPQEKVLVEVSQRNKVINNLSDTINIINSEQIGNSLYLSKFVAACGVGLFDAALNFLWDETVLNLRQKVSNFDLGYFFDSTISDQKRRSNLHNEEDLVDLTDYELIEGCKKIGIISDIAYKHLDYIRDMRNWASAAHPNQSELTGLNLLSWLETCLKEVISKEPEQSAIETKRLLDNIRKNTLTKQDAEPIKEHIERLSVDRVTSLLCAIFGMYTDTNTSVTIKNNIKLIAAKCWVIVSNEEKYKYGIKYNSFSVNADIERKKLAEEFLNIVGGSSFLPEDDLSLKILESVENLKNAHYGMNNFYNEPSHAKILLDYIPENGSIPKNIRYEYVKILVLVSVGNGWGISRSAKPYYDKMLNRFQEDEFKEFTNLLFDDDILFRLKYRNCAESFIDLAKSFCGKTGNAITQRALDLITKSSPAQLPNLGKDSRFKDILKGFNN